MIGLVTSTLFSVELFARAFGRTGSYWDEARSLVQTSDGGFVMAGRTNSYGAGSTDFLVIKLDASGNRVWAKTFGGSSGDEAYSIIQTSDGGYAVVGFTYNTSTSHDFLIIKMSSDGAWQWAKTFGGNYSDQAYSIIQTSDGGYAVTGYVRNASGYSDFSLLKLGPSGNMEWWKAYGGGGNEYLYSLIQTSDGGYALAGYTYSYGTGGGYEDILVIKLNASGDTLQWAKTFGGNYSDQAYSIIQTSDGGYAVTGYVRNASGYSDFSLLKLGPSGNMEWWKAYGGGGNEYLYSLIQTSDGGYALAGYTDSFGSGGQDYLIVKLNTSGDTLWTRTFGTSSADQARSITQTSDGGYAIVGMATATSGYDAMILKISGEGNYPGCHLRSWAIPSSSPALNTSSPTPTANSFTLSLSDYIPTVTDVTPTVTDLCTPLYEGTEERSGREKGHGVICVVRAGGAIFISTGEMPLRLYASDGSLIHSSKLRMGENWVPLGSGVYFWRAGMNEGKTVVR